LQGSLDNPPIIFVSRRAPSVGASIGLLLFVLAELAIILHSEKLSHTRLVLMYCSLAFSSALLLFAVYQIFRPSLLRISQSGISVQWQGRRPTQFAWTDISSFRPIKLRRQTLVGLIYCKESPKRTFARKVDELFGADVSLGGNWEVPSTTLCNLLNEARTLWIARKDSP
jgi:hypothetical protein